MFTNFYWLLPPVKLWSGQLLDLNKEVDSVLFSACYIGGFQSSSNELRTFYWAINPCQVVSVCQQPEQYRALIIKNYAGRNFTGQGFLELLSAVPEHCAYENPHKKYHDIFKGGDACSSL